ncbi:MAG: toll/interleukin-1 receptor domain-containing protein [Lachnospiraceae bacterium]|nr:toll/interleukin-1 receptor domain-containing protein [Lachnospiraceae bacterium]
MKYKAFISYRHKDIDEVVARHVQKIIERYRVPKKIAKTIGKTHVGKVFRDSDELQAASNLSEIIRSAIEESEWLIVICTKRYKESVWCMEEVEHFVELNGREKVLVILVEGEPNESFPSILTEIEVNGHIRHIEPLAVDIRGNSEREIIKNLNNEQFRFLSSILKVDYDDLKNRQRERRIRRIATAATAAFTILAVILGLIIKNNIELYNSNQETLRGESYFLSEYADAAFAEGDRDTAIKLALTALPANLKDPDRPFVPRAMQALTSATGVYDYTAGYHENFSKNIEGTVWYSFTTYCDDGSTLLKESYIQIDEIIYDCEFEVIRVSDGKTLFKGKEPPTSLDTIELMNNNPCTRAVLSRDGQRLYYLTEESVLTCVDVSSKAVVFSIDDVAAEEMRMDPLAAAGHTAITTMDYKDKKIYCYDLDGNETFSTGFPDDYWCILQSIDHKSGRILVITRNDPDKVADFCERFTVIDPVTGSMESYEPENDIMDLYFSGKDLVTYLTYNYSDVQWHIGQYDLKAKKEKYLCDAPIISKNLVLIEDGEKCYYFQDDTICEIDCTKDGKKLWEYKASSNINSLYAGNGIVAAGTDNGTVYVFEEDGKKQLKTPDGNGNPVYIGGVSQTSYTTIGDRGRSVHVFVVHDTDYYKDTKKGSVADIGGGLERDRWGAMPTEFNRFMIAIGSGEQLWLAEYDSETLEKISEGELRDVTDGLQAFINYWPISVNTIVVNTDNAMFFLDSSSMKETYRSDKTNSFVFYPEDGNILYDNIMSVPTEDGSTFAPKDVTFRAVDPVTGKVIEERKLPDGVYKALPVGDHMAFETENGIRIENADGVTEAAFGEEDGFLCCVNEKRGLLPFQTASGMWRIYDVNKKEIVFEEPVGGIPYIGFFGNNRYMIRDYEAVYDMDTWEKILTLNPKDGVIMFAQSADESPYIIFSCIENGNTVGRIYEKGKDSDMIGVINNFVSMAPDGEVIVFDNDQTLYKIPVLSAQQIKQKAEQMVGDPALSPEQKEKYHIFR